MAQGMMLLTSNEEPLAAVMRPTLPGCPLIPDKLNVASLVRVRLPRMRSADLTPPPPVVTDMLVRPCAKVTAPTVSEEAVLSRPVKFNVPP